jgi:PAS domain-containing protein
MEPSPAFLVGDSAMARLLRAHDFSRSDVGAPHEWPQSLRSVVNLMLGSGFPMFVAWGPRLEMLYNDGYAEILGRKHPASVGAPFERVWHDILTDIMPFVRRALAGETFFMENLPLRMKRKGEEEDTWFTFSYSPVVDEQGQTSGFYCACAETTSTVLAERHQRLQQERLQALFAQAPGFLAVVRGPEHVFEVVNPGYVRLIGHREVVGRTVRDALPEVVAQGFVELLDRVYRTGQAYQGHGVHAMLDRGPGGAPSEVILDFVYQPLLDPAGQVDGIFVYGHEVTEQHRA